MVHPPPGADGRPSFTALVASVDSDSAKYMAECRVQTSRQEMIDDLGEMAEVRSSTQTLSSVSNTKHDYLIQDNVKIVHGLQNYG